MRITCILVGLFMLLCVTPQSHAATTILVVDTTDDAVTNDGRTSLREALLAANASSGPERIVFNIPVTDAGFDGTQFGILVEPQTSAEQLILTDSGSTLDGATQTAFTGDTNLNGPEVIMYQSIVLRTAIGLQITGNDNRVSGLGFRTYTTSLEIIGNQNVVVGCTFQNHVQTGIHVTGSNNTIGGVISGAGNRIGGDSPGAPNGPNGILISGVEASGNRVQGNTISTNYDAGVVITGSASGNLIGGTQTGARNIIAGNGHRNSASRTPVGAQVRLDGTNNQVQGNYIGLDTTGTQPQAGEARSGVEVSGAFNTIGGTVPGAGNVISGHSAFSFRITTRPAAIRVVGGNTTHDIVIQGNRIGTNAEGTAAMPNERGIVVEDSLFDEAPHDLLIGGTTPGAGNLIAFNTMEGIVSTGNGPIYPTGIQISGNAIFGNGLLGIDLSGDDVTPNDPGDGDAGDNHLQNFPVIDSAIDTGVTTTVIGRIDTAAPQRITIEAFSNDIADPLEIDEGQIFQSSATPDVRGGFTMTLPGGLVGQRITATARDVSGNTSEFSQAQVVILSESSSSRIFLPMLQR